MWTFQQHDSVMYSKERHAMVTKMKNVHKIVFACTPYIINHSFGF